MGLGFLEIGCIGIVLIGLDDDHILAAFALFDPGELFMRILL